jgi:hypothetical protein
VPGADVPLLPPASAVVAPAPANVLYLATDVRPDVGGLNTVGLTLINATGDALSVVFLPRELRLEAPAGSVLAVREPAPLACRSEAPAVLRCDLATGVSGTLTVVPAREPALPRSGGVPVDPRLPALAGALLVGIGAWFRGRG